MLNLYGLYLIILHKEANGLKTAERLFFILEPSLSFESHNG